MSLVHLSEHIFRSKHRNATNLFLSSINNSLDTYKTIVNQQLEKLAQNPQNTLNMGKTLWSQEIRTPTDKTLNLHGLILGATGSGKSFYALNILQQVLKNSNSTTGIGILDPK